MNKLALMSAASLVPVLALDTETVAAGAGTAAPAVDPNVLVFAIPNATDVNGQPVSIAVNIPEIPPEVRLDGLKTWVRNYIINSVNQAHIRNTKELEPWTAYDAAMAADPLQTAVPKPEGERPTVDLTVVAADARKRLYEGKVKKAGERKARETKDPLIKMVTEAVTREVFEKNKASTPGYKWMDATKEVGTDGVAYLNAKIEEKVAAGADRATLQKVMDERYIKPVELVLGRRTTKATETSLL